MKKIIRTDNKNVDFNKLIIELDAYLKVTDGADHEFYNQFNGLDNIKNVVIAYQDSQAIGCGAFKKLDNETIEIINIYLKNNTPITTLELKKFVSKDVLNNYHNLSTKKIRWIPCEKELHTIDSFLLNNWLERLFISRLEQKSKSIMLLLSESKNHWEAVLFQLLAKNFGLKVNGESFLKLAKSIPFSVLKKEQNDITRLSALFFGQAGFLSEIISFKANTFLMASFLATRKKPFDK